jgi:hypothetical protein
MVISTHFQNEHHRADVPRLGAQGFRSESDRLRVSEFFCSTFLTSVCSSLNESVSCSPFPTQFLFRPPPHVHIRPRVHSSTHTCTHIQTLWHMGTGPRPQTHVHAHTPTDTRTETQSQTQTQTPTLTHTQAKHTTDKVCKQCGGNHSPNNNSSNHKKTRQQRRGNCTVS